VTVAKQILSDEHNIKTNQTLTITIRRMRRSNCCLQHTTFIKISHSVSQSGDCNEANAVCSKQHLYELATQYHYPVTVSKQLLSAAHNIYTNQALSITIRWHWRSNCCLQHTKYIPISHSVSKSVDCNEATAVCSTVYIYTNYPITITILWL